MADNDPEKRPICFEQDGIYSSTCLAGVFFFRIILPSVSTHYDNLCSFKATTYHLYL